MDDGPGTSDSKAMAALAAAFMLMTAAVSQAETGEAPQSQTTTVSIIIPERISVREVKDASATASTVAGDDEATVDLCVWSQGAEGAYQVTVVSDTGGYRLIHAESSSDIDFTVQWSSQTGQTRGAAIPYDTATPLAPVTSTTPTCGGAGHANSTITVETADGDLSLREARAAGYDATLTVTVAAAP